ncbi:unannotated protein [freshwater metagenome]|uniref:Unannotated protein n=1 Tax=freshwater metagenome TaxID=449393 RepID=A0A6J7PYP9_9ZZZZ
MPGIENFAPERTETKSGFAGLPNSFPKAFSKSFSAPSISDWSVAGIFPLARNSRHASVVIVNPGGTGKPILTISAKFAPLPPNKSAWVRSPTENGKINECAIAFLSFFISPLASGVVESVMDQEVRSTTASHSEMRAAVTSVIGSGPKIALASPATLWSWARD